LSARARCVWPERFAQVDCGGSGWSPLGSALRPVPDARDRHDFERANELRVRGSIWFDAERDPHADDEARQKAEFEWESVMGAKSSCHILGEAGGGLGAEASEENRS
jgi:hypothetical protein